MYPFLGPIEANIVCFASSLVHRKHLASLPTAPTGPHTRPAMDFARKFLKKESRKKGRKKRKHLRKQCKVGCGPRPEESGERAPHAPLRLGPAVVATGVTSARAHRQEETRGSLKARVCGPLLS